MASKYSPQTEPKPSNLNRTFWKQAFLAAELSTVIRHGTKIEPKGLAHLAADYADAALTEYRIRFQR